MEHITTIYYKKNTECITIVGVTNGAAILELPNTIAGLPVVALGDFSFAMPEKPPVSEEKHKANLAFVLVDEMGEKLPSTCALEQLFLPDTLTNLGQHAFQGCMALESIVLPEGILELPPYAFENCANLTHVGLPHTLENVGEYAFFGCGALEMLSLPEGVLEVGKYAFYNCCQLETINIPRNCKSLGMGVFLNCNRLFDIAVEQDDFLSEITENLNQALRLTISFADGKAQILLPDYQSEYIENTPARMLSQVHYGSGHVYRQCVGKRTVDFRGYDKLFYMAKREDAGILALQMALGRLEYPYRLYDEYRQVYLEYLGEHFLWTMQYLLQQKDDDTLEHFANWGVYTKENITSAIALAQKTGRTGLVGFLLNHQRVQFGGSEKKGFAL